MLKEFHFFYNKLLPSEDNGDWMVGEGVGKDKFIGTILEKLSVGESNYLIKEILIK